MDVRVILILKLCIHVIYTFSHMMQFHTKHRADVKEYVKS